MAKCSPRQPRSSKELQASNKAERESVFLWRRWRFHGTFFIQFYLDLKIELIPIRRYSCLTSTMNLQALFRRWVAGCADGASFGATMGCRLFTWMGLLWGDDGAQVGYSHLDLAPKLSPNLETPSP